MQWCQGMYASGSTWVVHALRSTGSLLFPDRPHTTLFVETADDLPLGWSRSERLIVKTHHLDGTAATLLLRGAKHIWISVRDPRDCVASLMTYMNEDFETALDNVAKSAWQCERVIASRKGTLLRYEDRFFDEPATLDRFAGCFARALSNEDRESLFQLTRRDAIERMIRSFDPKETVDDGFPGHRVHIPTQWHTHHANRTGEIGRWRQSLDPAQISDVERFLCPWMERFGYLPGQLPASNGVRVPSA
ncbi:MAG: hypothetical protein EXR07_02420 [Acetobacteraceae bacterium]|nr:hypothetical protein [Acetobacteraceae bacterium]